MSDNRELATLPDPDFSAVLASQNSKAVFLPGNLAEAMQLAHFMAGGIGVRQWMRGNPSACLALIQISMRWGLDPYIVANKAYYTNDTLAFESQLVSAVINTSGQLIGRLKIEFAGDAAGSFGQETLNCRVSGRLEADPDLERTLEQPLRDVKIRNSPLWKVNPKLQLAYHATRSWARLYMPEVLLGIYTPDEITDGVTQRLEDQSQPRDATPAPDRRQFVEGREEQTHGEPAAGKRILSGDDAQDAQFEEIRTHVPDETTGDAGKSDGHNAEVEGLDSSGPDRAGRAGYVDNDDNSAARANSDDGRNRGGASEPAVNQTGDILDSVPIEPLEWAAWKPAARAAVEAVASRKQFDSLRRRLAPALEAADNSLLEEVQDWLSDKLVALPEEAK